MKVLLIWLGKMGQFHLQNLLQIDEITHIYAFDVFSEAFKIQNDKITYSTDLEDFDDKVFDFVDIVAPTKFHYNYLEKYVKEDKYIFVEKPIVSNLEELEKLEKVIHESNYSKEIGVWFIERFNVVSKFFKQQIKQLGEPKQVEIFRYNPGSSRIWDTDVTTDLMIHDIDLIHYFFDNEQISLVWKNIENYSSTILLKTDKTNITLSANRITQQKIRQIKFYYDELTIVWDLILGKVDLYHKPSEYLTKKWLDLSITYMLEEKTLTKTNQLQEELQEFIHIIQWWDFKNLWDLDSGKSSMNLLDRLTQ